MTLIQEIPNASEHTASSDLRPDSYQIHKGALSS